MLKQSHGSCLGLLNHEDTLPHHHLKTGTFELPIEHVKLFPHRIASPRCAGDRTAHIGSGALAWLSTQANAKEVVCAHEARLLAWCTRSIGLYSWFLVRHTSSFFTPWMLSCSNKIF